MIILEALLLIFLLISFVASTCKAESYCIKRVFPFSHVLFALLLYILVFLSFLDLLIKFPNEILLHLKKLVDRLNFFIRETINLAVQTLQLLLLSDDPCLLLLLRLSIMLP